MTADKADTKVNRLRSRWNFLKRLGVGVTIGLGVTGATSERADALDGLVGTNQSFGKDEGIRISMDDETELAATLYEPVSGTPAPAILIRPGGLSTRFVEEAVAEFWAKNGYAALVYSPRGIGDSGGLAYPWSDIDTEDSRAIIDCLADRDSVQVDENDPALGMDGFSGGGIQQFRTAAVDNRVDALMPRGTPRDFWDTNDVGVLPWAWTYFAYLLFLGSQANVDPTVVALWKKVIENREPTDEWPAYYANRLPVSEADQVNTPTLLIHNWRDRAFKPNKVFRNYRGLSKATERRLIVRGRGRAHNFLNPTPTTDETAFVDEAKRHWMDEHLRGNTRDCSPVIEDSRPIHFYHSQKDEFESYSTFPSGERSFALQNSNRGHGTTALKTSGDGAPHGMWFDFSIKNGLELAGGG